MPAVTIFSKNLRNLLEERNRTQKDLADYIGVSPAMRDAILNLFEQINWIIDKK